MALNQKSCTLQKEKNYGVRVSKDETKWTFQGGRSEPREAQNLLWLKKSKPCLSSQRHPEMRESKIGRLF